MKRLFTIWLSAFLLLSTGTKGQTYVFEFETGVYTDLDNLTIITHPVIPWVENDWTLDIGFDFPFFDMTFSTVTINDGTLYFSDDLFVDAFGTSGLIDRGIFVPTDPTLSPVGYQVSGSSGNRIFQFEYENASFDFGTVDDFINFQIWLYEATGAIEVRIGPGEVAPEVYNLFNWDGPYIGISNLLDSEFLYIQDDPENPTVYTADDASTGFIGTPPSGMVYRFIPKTVGVGEPLSMKEGAPAVHLEAGTVTINNLLGGEQIWIYDTRGQLFFQAKNQGGQRWQHRLETEQPGIYLVSIQQAGQLFTEKVVSINN